MTLFSHQTKGTIVQLLNAIQYEDARVFFFKHLGIYKAELCDFIYHISNVSDETLREIIREFLSNNKMLRAGAPIKNVFDSGIVDLERWVLHDGWIVENGALLRVTPAAEEITGIRDTLLEDLANSGLDNEGAIVTAIENSAKHFVANPPDFNGSVTNVRIALETVARNAAKTISTKRGCPYLDDKWGKALQLLRSQGVIEQEEEDTLSRVYTFISPGAHIPKGITEEEWARLARTFGLSSAYFLLKKYAAA